MNPRVLRWMTAALVSLSSLVFAAAKAAPQIAPPAVPPPAAVYGQSSPPRQIAVEKNWGPWAGPYRTALSGKMMQDFGEQYLYAPINAKTPPPAPGEKRVVFIGDSITDFWDLATFFPGKPYLNRGIGAQVSPQLVLRFHADVVALKPRAVVILVGVNDVTGFLQEETPAQIEANYEAMFDIAKMHGIKVIFGSILPVNNYTPNAAATVEERHPDELRDLNLWLKDFARKNGCGYIDYYSAMVDSHGLMRAELTRDGIHPTPAGYKIMAPLAEAEIERSLRGLW